MSQRSHKALFSSGSIGAIAVTNRIAMAPLTRSRAGMDGVHSPLANDYYRQRASAGLILSEATNISQQGRGYAFTPGIYTDAQAAAWQQITQTVHQAGGKIVCQLWHVGRMSHVDLQDNGAAPVAPSAIRAGELIFLESRTQARPSMPRALATHEVADIVRDYRNVARQALNAGFDGVEVHSANCYLSSSSSATVRTSARTATAVRSRIAHASRWKSSQPFPRFGAPSGSASGCRPSPAQPATCRWTATRRAPMASMQNSWVSWALPTCIASKDRPAGSTKPMRSISRRCMPPSVASTSPITVTTARWPSTRSPQATPTGSPSAALSSATPTWWNDCDAMRYSPWQTRVPTMVGAQRDIRTTKRSIRQRPMTGTAQCRSTVHHA